MEPFLYVPFEGKIDPQSGASFQSAETIFTGGKFGKGIKMSRHGYDRKAVALPHEVGGGVKGAVSFLLFCADWDGAGDRKYARARRGRVGLAQI